MPDFIQQSADCPVNQRPAELDEKVQAEGFAALNFRHLSNDMKFTSCANPSAQPGPARKQEDWVSFTGQDNQ